MRANAKLVAFAAGLLLVVNCSGTAGELFDPKEGSATGAGEVGAGSVSRGGGGGGLGGAESIVSSAGTANGGAAPLAAAGAAMGLAGDSSEKPGASGGSSGGEAGAGGGVAAPAPPSCDPCPCGTGPFGEPELVAGLESSVPTSGPAPSIDGLTLYFSALGATEDIFVATRSTRANGFTAPLPVTAVNGDDTEEGTPFISADNRSLYFFSIRPEPAAPGDRDLWVATRPDAAAPFSEPGLVADVNTADLEHLPRLTPDGLTLMFVSGRDTANLGSNIWQARRESVEQPFGEAVELPGVNSDGRDEGFWLSADGLTVFFASNRGGENDMDLWVATRDRVGDAFGPAQSFDVANTPSRELDPALTDDGFELFFASDRSGTMQLYRMARQCL